jgi:hypothetical protein
MIQIRRFRRGDPAAAQFQATLRERLIQAELSGAKIVAREQMPDGTVWVLLSLPRDEAKRAAIAALGRHPEMPEAEAAVQEMDAALAKTKPQVIEK